MRAERRRIAPAEHDVEAEAVRDRREDQGRPQQLETGGPRVFGAGAGVGGMAGRDGEGRASEREAHPCSSKRRDREEATANRHAWAPRRPSYSLGEKAAKA